jgi:hypothetical protein
MFARNIGEVRKGALAEEIASLVLLQASGDHGFRQGEMKLMKDYGGGDRPM